MVYHSGLIKNSLNRFQRYTETLILYFFRCRSFHILLIRDSFLVKHFNFVEEGKQRPDIFKLMIDSVMINPFSQISNKPNKSTVF